MMSFDLSTTVGVEIEIQDLSRHGLPGLDNIVRHSVHDDGSIRSPTYQVAGIGVIPQKDERGEPILCNFMTQERDFGLEVVTQPYTFGEFYSIADKVAAFFGHVPQTPRTSIHIHVDVGGAPWTYIKNVILWARQLEAPLYRIAAGGGIHRGERSYKGKINDHRYARPFSAPIAAEWGDEGELRPLIDWDALATSRTASEFLRSWGRLDMAWNEGLTHYCPHRLHMLNLASVMRQGTLEWRLFDGIYRHLPLFLRVVYGVHELAQYGPPLSSNGMDLGSSSTVIDCTEISSLLNVDVSPAWGALWPAGIADTLKKHHYTQDFRLNSGRPTRRIRAINAEESDDNSATYPLYVRD